MSEPLACITARVWSLTHVAQTMSSVEDDVNYGREHRDVWAGVERTLNAIAKDLRQLRQQAGPIVALALAVLAIASQALAKDTADIRVHVYRASTESFVDEDTDRLDEAVQDVGEDLQEKGLTVTDDGGNYDVAVEIALTPTKHTVLGIIRCGSYARTLDGVKNPRMVIGRISRQVDDWLSRNAGQVRARREVVR